MRLGSLFAVLGFVLAMLFLFGCSTESEVRAACKGHDGVNAVSGNSSRKYVACNDGHYETVR